MDVPTPQHQMNIRNSDVIAIIFIAELSLSPFLLAILLFLHAFRGEFHDLGGEDVRRQANKTKNYKASESQDSEDMAKYCKS